MALWWFKSPYSNIFNIWHNNACMKWIRGARGQRLQYRWHLGECFCQNDGEAFDICCCGNWTVDIIGVSLELQTTPPRFERLISNQTFSRIKRITLAVCRLVERFGVGPTCLCMLQYLMCPANARLGGERNMTRPDYLAVFATSTEALAHS